MSNTDFSITLPAPATLGEDDLMAHFMSLSQKAAKELCDKPTRLVGMNLDVPTPTVVNVQEITAEFTVPQQTRSVLFLHAVLKANGKVWAHGSMTRQINQTSQA